MNFKEVVFDLNEYVIEKSKEGFFQGQPSARTVYSFYCQRMIVHDDERASLKKGYVFPASTHPSHVAKCTGLAVMSVRRANRWLEEQGLIEITEAPGWGYAKCINVQILPQEDW